MVREVCIRSSLIWYGEYQLVNSWTNLCPTQDVETENEFEKALLADVIAPSDIGVTFDDVGALENVKDTLKELVMLPLQRPELFSKSQLTKVLHLQFYHILLV